MKKLYMHTIIGSSGSDHVLIILFQLYRTNSGFLKVIYSDWATLNLHIGIGKRTDPILIELHTIYTSYRC